MNETHKTDHHANGTHTKNKKTNLMPIIALVIVLALIGIVAAVHSGSKSGSKKSSTSSTPVVSSNAKLYLKPSSQQVASGGTLTVEVWVDTGGDPVNAVQANLTYPTDKFDFNSIDTKDSAFEVQALSKGGDGKISIARGHIGDVKGPALVAKVVLVAKTDKGDGQVSFSDGSAVVRSTDHKDILKEKTGSTYTVSLGAPRVAVAQITKVGKA
jgi:flagellar basal body-associated protein FliL